MASTRERCGSFLTASYIRRRLGRNDDQGPSVLIAVFRGNQTVPEAAMRILDDPDRDLVVSEFLRLEALPKPIYQIEKEEVAFLQEIFQAATETVLWSQPLTHLAMQFAVRYGLSAIDAIHASAAVLAQVDELVTGEKPTKPLCRVREARVVSLYEEKAT